MFSMWKLIGLHNIKFIVRYEVNFLYLNYKTAIYWIHYWNAVDISTRYCVQEYADGL